MTSPKNNDLDHILACEEVLLPSSGFAASVMESIAKSVSEPAPIPFPWKRALPGVAVLVIVLAIILKFATALIRFPLSTAAHSVAPSWITNFPAQLQAQMGSVGAVSGYVLGPVFGTALLALAASLICVLVCRRLAGVTSAS